MKLRRGWGPSFGRVRRLMVTPRSPGKMCVGQWMREDWVQGHLHLESRINEQEIMWCYPVWQDIHMGSVALPRPITWEIDLDYPWTWRFLGMAKNTQASSSPSRYRGLPDWKWRQILCLAGPVASLGSTYRAIPSRTTPSWSWSFSKTQFGDFNRSVELAFHHALWMLGDHT